MGAVEVREAINSNPIVQVALLGGLALLVAVLFMTNMSKDEPAPAEDAATATDATADPAAPVTPTTSTDPVTPAPEAVTPVGSTAFEPSKGLPKEVVEAHASGDVVVLLVMQNKGVEDKELERAVRTLEADGGTSVFVSHAKHVAKYSRIAEGVNLDRVPAIVVLHPLKGKAPKGEALALPEASVSYGYRGPESVRQTVADALYNGDVSAYHPN